MQSVNKKKETKKSSLHTYDSTAMVAVITPPPSLSSSISPSLQSSRPGIFMNCTVQRRHQSSNGIFSVRAYMENPNSISGFVSKVIGSLPVVGLLARIVSDEGGVGGDLIDFAEFRRRVGKQCTIMDSRAFIEFKDRRGKVNYLFWVCCLVCTPCVVFDKILHIRAYIIFIYLCSLCLTGHCGW
ncbi:Photosystem I assembly factor PSA3, chloroplastic [Linum grandiflorum]